MKAINPFVISLVLCLGVGSAFGQIHSGPNCITFYVNCITGNDTWDGLSPTYVGGTSGPKATIQSGVNAASWNDVLNIAGEYYNESVTIDKHLTLAGPSLPSIMHLTLTNNSVVQLIDNFHILGTLTLLSGELRTSAHRITIANPEPGAVAIAEGCVTGEIERAIAGGSTGAYRFTNAHTCVVPNGTQPLTWISIRAYPNQLPPAITGGTPINRFYEIMASQPLNGALVLAYLQPELNGIPEPNLTSFRHMGVSWANQGGTVNIPNRCVELSGAVIPAFSSWTLGDITSPLPIQLASFSASVTNGSDVQLNWRTLTETNNFGFYIQRSLSASSQYIDVPNSFVPGHGTTIEPHDYTWTHQGVSPGTYYYRLKQVDLDGTIHYSDGREVEVSSPTGVAEGQTPETFSLAQNYPNPFNPSTQIQFTVDRSGYTTLTVYDVLGKEVGVLYTGIAEPRKLYSSSFDASHLTNGTYFYKLRTGAQTSLRKMLLLK